MKNILFFAIVLITISAQNGRLPEIENLLGAEKYHDDYSIFIYDPQTQDTLYASNIYKPLIPASNIKLYPTAAALDLLGASFDLSTKIFTDDEIITDSVVEGNLYIKGFGDALLTGDELDSACALLYTQGIRKVKGNVIGDELYFDKVYTRDDWIKDERANVYLPPISGLSLDRNKIVLKLYRNKEVNSFPTFELVPPGSFYNVDVSAKVTKFSSRPRISLRTRDAAINISVSGGVQKKSYPYNYLIYPDSPAVFTALYFKDLLEKNGITVAGKARSGETPLPGTLLVEVKHHLTELINEVNKKSDNYLAENLFKILGAQFSLKEGNSFYATQAVMTFLEEYGLFAEGTNIVDGSGISRFNKTTTASIVSLLEFIYFDINRFDFYFNSLSISGVDGTLDDRLFESSAYQNFRGKTGSLYGVSSISGYLTTANNNDLIISIIMNDTSKNQKEMRDLQDKIIRWCAENL